MHCKDGTPGAGSGDRVLRIPNYERSPRWACELASATVPVSGSGRHGAAQLAVTFAVLVPALPRNVTVSMVCPGSAGADSATLRFAPYRDPTPTPTNNATTTTTTNTSATSNVTAGTDVDGGKRRMRVHCAHDDGKGDAYDDDVADVGSYAPGEWISVGVHVGPGKLYVAVGAMFRRNLDRRHSTAGLSVQSIAFGTEMPGTPLARTRMTLSRVAIYLGESRKLERLVKKLACFDAPVVVPDAYFPLDDPLGLHGSTRCADAMGAWPPLECEAGARAWSARCGTEPAPAESSVPRHTAETTPLICMPLLASGLLSDVALRAGNDPAAAPIAAHRSVLAHESPYFRSLFTGGSSGAFREAAAAPAAVVIPDCGRPVLELLVRTLYGAPLGFVNFGQECGDSLFGRWRAGCDKPLESAGRSLPSPADATYAAMVGELMELACLSDMLGTERVTLACVRALLHAEMFGSVAQVVDLLLATPPTQNCLARVRRGYLAWLAFRRDLLDADPRILKRLAAGDALAEVDAEAKRMQDEYASRHAAPARPGADAGATKRPAGTAPPAAANDNDDRRKGAPKRIRIT